MNERPIREQLRARFSRLSNAELLDLRKCPVQLGSELEAEYPALVGRRIECPGHGLLSMAVLLVLQQLEIALAVKRWTA